MLIPASLLVHLGGLVPKFTAEQPRDQWSLPEPTTIALQRHRTGPSGVVAAGRRSRHHMGR